MFKINRKIEYALIALKHMSQKNAGGLTSAKEICDTYKIPFDPTSRVLQIMAQKGVIKAAYGAHGGYLILKDLSKFTFVELITMVTGPMKIANCLHGSNSLCEFNSQCNLIAPMLNLNEYMHNLFKTLSIKDLLESKHSSEQKIKAKPLEKLAAVGVEE